MTKSKSNAFKTLTDADDIFFIALGDVVTHFDINYFEIFGLE